MPHKQHKKTWLVYLISDKIDIKKIIIGDKERHKKGIKGKNRWFYSIIVGNFYAISFSDYKTTRWKIGEDIEDMKKIDNTMVVVGNFYTTFLSNW